VAGAHSVMKAGAPRRGLLAAIRVAITVAIVGGLIVKLSPGEIEHALAQASPWLLAAALVLMCVVQALVVVKWLVLLRARDVSVRVLAVVRAYCVGNLLSNVLPTAVGGDVYRVYRIQREGGAPARDVTMTVLYERATGYGAMTCLGALGATFHYGSAATGVVVLAAGAGAALLLGTLLPRLPFPAIRHDHLLRHLLAHRRELTTVYRMFVFSLAIQALYISAIALGGRALGIHLSWWYWALTTWIVAVATLMPVTPGGLGVRESSFSALVKRGGSSAAQGASAGFVLGLLLIAANAAGLVAVEVVERARRRVRAAYGPAPLSSAEAVTVEP